MNKCEKESEILLSFFCVLIGIKRGRSLESKLLRNVKIISVIAIQGPRSRCILKRNEESLH